MKATGTCVRREGRERTWATSISPFIAAICKGVAPLAFTQSKTKLENARACSALELLDAFLSARVLLVDSRVLREVEVKDFCETFLSTDMYDCVAC